MVNCLAPLARSEPSYFPARHVMLHDRLPSTPSADTPRLRCMNHLVRSEHNSPLTTAEPQLPYSKPVSPPQDVYGSPLTFSGGASDSMMLALVRAVHSGLGSQLAVSLEQALPLRPTWLNFNRFRPAGGARAPAGGRASGGPAGGCEEAGPRGNSMLVR